MFRHISAHFRRFFAEFFSYKVKPVIHRLFSPKNSRYYILYDEYIYSECQQAVVKISPDSNSLLQRVNAEPLQVGMVDRRTSKREK